MANEAHIRYSNCMSKRLAAVKILFALGLAVVIARSGAAWAQVNSVSLPLKAHQLTGMKVENSDGQKVGTIRNLVLDLKTGELKYVIVGSGGFLGVRGTLKVVPSQAMSAATAKSETVAVHATSPQWNQAPAFKLSSLAALEEPNHAREISRYFEPPSMSSLLPKTNLLSTTGGETGTNAPGPKLKFASSLIGMRVVNQNQEKIGEVLDLFVNLGKPRPAFAIISSGRLFHKEYQYAVPLSALIPSESERKLTLNANTATLQQTPPFTQRVWQEHGKNGSNRIYRYSAPED